MTNPAPNDELATLRTHNAELLAELKAAKARAKTAEDALQEATTAAEAAQGELQAIKLDGPVQRVLQETAVDPEVFRGLFERHYRFALDEAGGVAIVDQDGNPAMVDEAGKKPRPASLARADIEALCAVTPEAERFQFHIRAPEIAGGGSRGFRPPTTTAKPDTKAEPRPSFGIR